MAPGVFGAALGPFGAERPVRDAFTFPGSN